MNRLLPVLACLLLAPGCAGGSDSRYPSLLPRPIETLSMAEPEVPPAPAATPDPALDARLAALGQTLDEAAAAFAPAADRAEQLAHGAAGAPVGSEGWIGAQTALAELDGYRATTSSTLTDIEQMAIERAAALMPPYPAIETLRASAETRLAAQTARIARIQAMLPAA